MSMKLASAFLDRVQRSGLVTKDRLPQLRQQLDERGADLGSAKNIAEALVDMEVLSRWQADKLLEGKHKGFFLGSYRLLRPLGRGGMGAVFLAQHEMMRRQCAIKVLPHSQIKEGSSVLERFYVEARAVASLDHQNIVRAYDVSMESKDDKETHYLVMEFVEGHDLQSLVQLQGVLDFVKAAEYLRQTANGLAHAHEAGLIHRDIKPANLLVDKKGVVKILDLGLARFFDDSEQASLTTTHNETVLGTADYLSPEQALNSHTVDHRTDIYSLGCTAYFMLVGNPPFPEGTVAQRLVAHQVKSPQPIKERRSNAPSDLVAIIDKMMAKKSEARFQSAGELATVLARWLLEHGGDDWKRQHSEIVGDKALMSLLSAREPTRTIRSSMSETELELAPLDDDDDDAGMVTAAGTSGSNLNLTGSGVRKAGESSGTRGRKPAAEYDDDLAPVLDDHDDQPPTKSVSAASGKPAGLASEPLLPPLDDDTGAGLEPLENLKSVDLASLGTGDLLGDLDQRDLMGTATGDDPLGAMDSNLRQVTRSGGSGSGTSSRSHRRLGRVAEKASPAPASIVGLPILIGGAGGLLLVLLILAIYYMPSGTDVATVGGTQQPAESQQDADALRPGDAADPAVDRPDTPPDIGPSDIKYPQYGDDPTQPLVGTKSEPPEPKKPIEKKPDEIPPPSKPEQQPSKPVEPPADVTVQPEPKVTTSEPEKTKPKVAKPDEKPPVEPQPDPRLKKLTPEQHLAAITGFRVEARGAGDGRKLPFKMTPPLLKLLQNIVMATDSEVREMAKRSELEYDPDQKPLMVLESDLQVAAPNIVLKLRAELQVEDESGEPVVLWSNDSELASFLPSANPNVVLGSVRSQLSRFFRDFRQKYEAAVAAHQAP